MKISTFGFLTRRGVRNLGKHWAMTIACIASLSVCMTLNIFASLIEVNVDSMVSYLGSQNEMVVYVDPEADDATIQSVGNALSGTAGVSRVQYMSKEDVLNQYKGYMSDYAALLNEFENDNPFKANYRVSLSDLSQMETISKQFENISGVYSVTAPIEMTKTFVEVQQAVTKVGRGLVLVLMAVSIITVGTTIRLSVFARRREIEIMKYVGATNALVTLPFVIEGLTMGLLSGILTAAATIGGYAYIVQLSPTLGGLWQMLMGTALVPLENVWPTILTYSLAGGALVGGLGSMFSIRKHLNSVRRAYCVPRQAFRRLCPAPSAPPRKAVGHSAMMRAACAFLAAACLVLSVTVYPASAATSMSSLQNKLDKISASIKQHKTELSDAKKKEAAAKALESELKEKVSVLQSQIGVLKSQISEVQNSIGVKEQEITAKQNEIARKEQEIADQWDDFKSHMAAMQELRDGGSVAMLQSVNDLYELLTFNEVMQDISVKDTEILDNMKAAKEALVADRTQLVEERTQLQNKKG